MITQGCDLYVIGRGFISPADLKIGDLVYTLDGFNVEITPIDYLQSDFISDRINRIDAGPNNILLTDNSLCLYYSEVHGFKYLHFSEIPAHTRDKAYQANKFLPVLSWTLPGERNMSNVDLEYIARMVLTQQFDIKSFNSIVQKCTGSDCLALVDMLEFWCSVSPGQGWFDKAQVKTRAHFIKDKYICEELAKVAVLAGYTSAIAQYDRFTYVLKVNYEPMPIPGSRPKNEKYYYTYYTGMIYTISARNLSIMGRSLNRIFYLPTTTDDIIRVDSQI